MIPNNAETLNATLESGTSSFKDKPKCKPISLSSSLIVETYTHTWKIKGFDDIPFISNYPIQSSNFTLGKENEDKSSFQIVMVKQFSRTNDASEDSEDDFDSDSDVSTAESEAMKPNLQKKETNASAKGRRQMFKRLGFRLVKIDDDSIWDVIDYTFTLKTLDGYSVKTLPREEPGDSVFETKPKFIFLSEKDFGDRNLFKEKYLDVVCDITYKYWKDHPIETPTICEERQFAEDLKLLHSSKSFCDVWLKIDDMEIHAHKSVLCARASEFENLLEENPASKQVFDLQMEADVGKAFVNFLYCGKLPNDFPIEKCIGLFRAADCYGIVNLKQRCSEYFKKGLPSGISGIDLGLRSSEIDLENVVKLDSAKIKRILSKKCTQSIEVNL